MIKKMTSCILINECLAQTSSGMLPPKGDENKYRNPQSECGSLEHLSVYVMCSINPSSQGPENPVEEKAERLQQSEVREDTKKKMPFKVT